MGQGVSHMYIVDQRTHDTFLRSLSISGLVRFSVILQWNWAHGELGRPQVLGLCQCPWKVTDSSWLLVFQMRLKTWVLSSLPRVAISLFLSFLLIFVVGTPQHEKQKHKRDEEVRGIDRYEG